MSILNSEGISAVKASYKSYLEKYVATKVLATFLADSNIKWLFKFERAFERNCKAFQE